MEKQKKYNHAFTLAFTVDSDNPEHCTFEEYLEGLLKRVGNLDDLIEAHMEDYPYDTQDNY